MEVPQLHLITPATFSAELLVATRAALDAGAPLVQVRAKGAGDREGYDQARRLRQLCRDRGARCLINDRVDLALAVDADGAHLGDQDLPVAVARRLLGAAAMVGATCRDPEAARRAVDAGATYLGVGPAYATSTKQGLPEPLGPLGIEAVASAVGIPVIAIAGVTAARVPELRSAGAWGVAVVGAVYAAADVGAAVAELLHALGGSAPGHAVAGDSAGGAGR